MIRRITNRLNKVTTNDNTINIKYCTLAAPQQPRKETRAATAATNMRR